MCKISGLVGATFASFLLGAPSIVWAEAPAGAIQQLQRQLNSQEKALKSTRQQLERLQLQMQKPATAESQAAKQAADSPQHKAGRKESTGQVGKPPPDQQQQEAAKVAPVMEQPGILTPQGHFSLEPSLQYSYSSDNRVDLIGFSVLPAIIVGLIDVREVRSLTAVGALTARYGLTNRLEATFKLPYVYRHDRTTTRPLMESATNDEVFNTSGSGLGDIELGLRYQFNQGGASLPYFIGSLRGILPTGDGPFEVGYTTSDRTGGKGLQTDLPTGSGSYGIETGLQAIYPSDPVVFYGNVNYLWRLSDDVDKTIAGQRIGKVEPGDSIKLGFGMGMSLNERSSLSFGYQHTYIGKTHINGLAASSASEIQLGQLLVGFAYQVTPDTSLSLTVGAGLTTDTPDVDLTLRVPIAF